MVPGHLLGARFLKKQKMIIRFCKLDKKAVMPLKAHLNDAAFDLVAVEATYSANSVIYDTGLAVDIPPGYCGLVFQRSSVAKKNLILSNAVGVIDSGYSGPIKCHFRRIDGYESYSPGERIAQIMFVQLPAITFVEVDGEEDFEHTTERGAGGYGSTGS